jgi:hypothetical protein
MVHQKLVHVRRYFLLVFVQRIKALLQTIIHSTNDVGFSLESKESENILT